MTPAGAQSQLELFDLTNQPAPRPRQQTLGRLFLQIRYDQLVLASIGGLIGVTIVFASGVERGKQLVRAEHALLAHQGFQSSLDQATSTGVRAEAKQPAPATPAMQTNPKAKPQPTPAPALKKSAPSKLASGQPGKSRYAVQVVSYRRPSLAQQELTRLQALGERAFLVLRDSYAVLYVGPFPSKADANDKLAHLKGRYQGCFIKAL